MEEWLCPLCPFELFAAAKELALHVTLWHDEWLRQWPGGTVV